MAFGSILGQIYQSDNLLVTNAINQYFGLPNNSVLDDVLLMLVAEGNPIVKIQFTVNGSPAKANIKINNITSYNNEPLFTDDNGVVVGKVNLNSSRQFTITSPTYVDLPALAKTFTVPEGTLYYPITVELGTPISGEKSFINTSGTTLISSGVWFSPYVTSVDVHVIDGGYDGKDITSPGGNLYNCGYGGDGGYQGWELNLQPERWKIIEPNEIIAGQHNGGYSTFLNVYSNKSQSATLRGQGGRGVSSVRSDQVLQRSGETGGNSQIRLYGNGEIVGGGGGGGGNAYLEESSATGGTPCGNGKAPGGGGGGRGFSNTTSFSIQNGGGGGVYYRWRVESV